MQKVVNLFSTTAGLSHDNPNYNDIPQIEALLAEGYKVTQIVSHGFIPNTLAVLMTVVLEKPDAMPPARPRRTASF